MAVSNGGSFVPSADYTVGGTWTFTGTTNLSGTPTFTSPAISGTVTGGASYTAPTLTSPTITGTTAIGNGATITTPVIAGGLTASGSGANDFSASTGTFKTSTGAVTLGTGAISITGLPTFTAGLLASGAVANDFSAGTGTFKTSSGANTLSGNTTLASGKTLTLSESTGILSAWRQVPATTYTSNNTPALITGLSWTVVAGTYVFELNLPATMTVNGGLTVAFALTTAVLTSINYQTYAATASDNTTAVSTNGSTGTSGTLVFDSVAAAYTHVNIKGCMVVGTGGTFQWNASQHTSAGGGDVTSLLVNGYATMTRIA